MTCDTRPEAEVEEEEVDLVVDDGVVVDVEVRVEDCVVDD